MPNYLLAMLIVVFLGVQPELLPVTAYVLTTVGAWMLVMKSSTVETSGEDYVTVARARGLTDRRIGTAYVGRNAVLPLFSQLAISLGFVVGGSILVEQVFHYQGGRLPAQSVRRAA